MEVPDVPTAKEETDMRVPATNPPPCIGPGIIVVTPLRRREFDANALGKVAVQEA